MKYECFKFLFYVIDGTKTKWKLMQRARGEIPAQRNGYDCGIYLIAFAMAIACRAKPVFGESDCISFRRQIAYELVSKALL